MVAHFFKGLRFAVGKTADNRHRIGGLKPFKRHAAVLAVGHRRGYHDTLFSRGLFFRYCHFRGSGRHYHLRHNYFFFYSRRGCYHIILSYRYHFFSNFGQRVRRLRGLFYHRGRSRRRRIKYLGRKILIEKKPKDA